MDDYLLCTWEVIHQELFIGIDGRPVISLSTLQQKHGPELKASGALFRWKIGRGRHQTFCVAGWRSVIMNHFIKLGQLEDAERVKAKALKKQQKADLDYT